MAASEESGRTSCTCLCAERLENSKPQADTVAIVVAGGSGERFGDPRGKQFVDLCGLPLMCWPLMALDRAPSVAHIVIVCAPDKTDVVKSDVLSRVVLKTPVSFAPSAPPARTRSTRASPRCRQATPSWPSTTRPVRWWRCP